MSTSTSPNAILHYDSNFEAGELESMFGNLFAENIPGVKVITVGTRNELIDTLEKMGDRLLAIIGSVVIWGP